MRTYLFSFLVLAMLILGMSCRKNFEYAPSAGNLEFSKDTVFLDTIFSNIGSATYSLRVFNPTRDDIEIPTIRLQQGEQSNYRLNVDGQAGKTFKNIPILAQDSMFIRIETTIDVSGLNTNEILYTDKILFDVDDDQQSVELVTLVKDAIFLYPNENSEGVKETISLGIDANNDPIEVEGFYLNNSQLQFTNSKPYVIYGYAAVPNEESLTIEAGARVYFHKDSGIYINNSAKLEVNGSLSTDTLLLENEVIFEGDRLEPQFNNIPGQWGAILIETGDNKHTINHLTIRNATVGLKIYNETGSVLPSNNEPSLTISNSQVYNSSNINLWAKSVSISAENLVLGGAGSQSLYCNIGGDYIFKHCTIANYWKHDFRIKSALQIDNFHEENSANLAKATFINCVIYGSQQHEFTLLKNTENSFNFSFTNCLIKFNNDGQFDNNPLYSFDNALNYTNNIFNEPTGFFNAYASDYRIDETSAANGKAKKETSLQIPYDLLGNRRSNEADIGAYESARNQ